MTSAILTGLLRVNLAATVAIGLVAVVRKPWRSAFGAQAAYALWALPPLAAAAVLLPARVVHVTVKLGPILHQVMRSGAPHADRSPLLLCLWLAGAALSLAVLAGRQRRLMARLGVLIPTGDALVYRADGEAAEPAVVGAFKPKIIIPLDFEQRFDAAQRAGILAHERSHLAHFDAQTNGLVALAQCLAWFNPFIHLAAHALHEDQELACDARVLARATAGDRRAYGEALVASQLNAPALPLGCHWPAGGVKSLKERLVMLKKPAPSQLRLTLGFGLATASALALSAAAWASQPAQTVINSPPLNDPAKLGQSKDHAQTAPQPAFKPVKTSLKAAPQVSVSNSVAKGGPDAAATPPSSVIENPDWQDEPSAADLEHYYPDRAQRSQATGRVVMQCIVTETGAVRNCTIASESPEGMQFGDAALAMAAKFKMSPATKDGAPAAGATVNIPIAFALN